MSAVIMDGKKLAKQAKDDIATQIKQSNKKLGLGTILVGDDPGSLAYVEGKHSDCAEVGINSIRVKLPKTASEQEIIKAVNDLNNNPECTGFIVQLPLPKSVNTEKVLLAIDPKKDADGLNPVNLGSLVFQHLVHENQLLCIDHHKHGGQLQLAYSNVELILGHF